MGKIKKRRAKFQYQQNRKKAWKKSKQLPDIKCPQIKDAWDKHKSVRNNLHAMGLAADPNQAVPISKGKTLGGEVEVAPIPVQRRKAPQNQLHVVSELESEANAPQEKTLRLSDPEVKFCTYLMDKYGEDYKAMARDKKNYYQETPKAIRNKIKTFMGVPEQYQEYLNSKQQKMDAQTT